MCSCIISDPQCVFFLVARFYRFFSFPRLLLFWLEFSFAWSFFSPGIFYEHFVNRLAFFNIFEPTVIKSVIFRLQSIQRKSIFRFPWFKQNYSKVELLDDITRLCKLNDLIRFLAFFCIFAAHSGPSELNSQVLLVIVTSSQSDERSWILFREFHNKNNTSWKWSEEISLELCR